MKSSMKLRSGNGGQPLQYGMLRYQARQFENLRYLGPEFAGVCLELAISYNNTEECPELLMCFGNTEIHKASYQTFPASQAPHY